MIHTEHQQRSSKRQDRMGRIVSPENTGHPPTWPEDGWVGQVADGPEPLSPRTDHRHERKHYLSPRHPFSSVIASITTSLLGMNGTDINQ